MYLPPAFREDRLEVQHALIRAYPLALLITAGRQGLSANPIPFLVDDAASSLGTLRAHVARANPLLEDLAEGAQCLVVFQGEQAYVTPAWYATKAATGKVVPTWNYVTVHAWGRAVLHDRGSWLDDQLDDLTAGRERNRTHPWAVSDAPTDYIAAQKKGIIGVEIAIERIEGKWKLSQNRNDADRAGVVAGLRAEGASCEIIADLVAAGGAIVEPHD